MKEAKAVSLSPQVREEILELLYHEAELLDEGRFDEWLDLLTDDIVYQMPVRMTRERGQRGDVSTEMQHFWDDRATLTLRVQRLKTEFAWAEDPPSRTRHFIMNVRLRATVDPDEIEVRSNVLIYRSRGDSPLHDLICGERRETVRRVNGVWKVARRVFVPDQATLNTKNLAIFV
jgi:ethylbenzene dioxygenase beta subunit